jgi:hypothetical protein
MLSLVGLVVASAISESAHAAPTMDGGATLASAGQVVVSEVMTGGASASDEFVELYNPSAVPTSLDGLELVYVTGSGATVTRKALWATGAEIGPGGHVLVANEAGMFAGIADVTYANGLAATGGSMAVRIVGATSALDAVGWGTASSAWLEGAPAPAPPAGSTLERLPGGELGSGQDSDQNHVDFVVRPSPDPQNAASPPVPTDLDPPTPSASEPASDGASPSPSVTLVPDPSATPSPTTSEAVSPSPTPEPTGTPTLTPSPTPEPTPTTAPTVTIAEARALPDGTPVTVLGTATTDAAFSEAGGYLADATGGIAVLVTDGTFPRGAELLVAGTVDDRFAQRTIRADAANVTVIGPGSEPAPVPVDTGSVNEAVEGRLVLLVGVVQGSPTALSSGLAYDLDDGSGPVRVLVGPGTGIDTGGWLPGASLSVVGVVGQRDSSGTGTDGYRVQPRDPADVLAVLRPPTPDPTPSPSPSSSPVPTPSPTASPSPPGTPVVPISAARTAASGTRLRIRGVVTLPTGQIEAGSAVVADASGAILVRSGSDGTRLRRGQLVELAGTRSTRSGMASLRLTQPGIVLGTQPDPAAARRATGRILESDEARLVVVRGIVRDGPRRTSGGGLTLTVNDGSGPLRVFVAGGTGISSRSLPSGGWVELRGVVGQQTTGSAPNAGYRLWPRDRADVRLIARPGGGGGRSTATAASTANPNATTGEPRPSAAPLLTVKPRLGGVVALAPNATPTTSPTRGASDLEPIRAPLAAAVGGLAGLLVLAWRNGTWGRLQAEVGQRLTTLRGSDEEEDESYTLAP